MEQAVLFDFDSLTNNSLECSPMLQSWQPINSLPFPLNLSLMGKCLVSVSLVLVSIAKLDFDVIVSRKLDHTTNVNRFNICAIVNLLENMASNMKLTIGCFSGSDVKRHHCVLSHQTGNELWRYQLIAFDRSGQF